MRTAEEPDFLGLKIGLTILLVAIQLVFILLPRLLGKVLRPTRYATFISYANAFSGAFMPSIALLHLLPEAVELFEEGNRDPLGAFALATVAFFVSWMMFHVWIPSLPCCSTHGHAHTHEHHKPTIDVDKLGSTHTGSGEDAAAASLTRDEPVMERDPLLSLFFVATVSVHCLVGGFVMGVQDEFTLFVSVFLSLALHKWAESLAVGASLAGDTGLSTRRWLLLSCCLPAASLLGVVLGAAVRQISDSVEVFVAVSSSISAGIFLFLGVVDILTPELLYGHVLWKSAFVMLGLLSALFLSLILGSH